MSREKETVLFKVLDGLYSCNGGHKFWRLGVWAEYKEPVAICERGLHLTINPLEWKGSDVYFAAARGIVAWKDDKCVCSRVKLLRLCAKVELDEYLAKRKPIDNEYWAKRNTIDDERHAKRKPIYDEYWAKRNTIDDERHAKLRTIDSEYWAKRNTIDEEHRERCIQAISALYKASPAEPAGAKA